MIHIIFDSIDNKEMFVADQTRSYAHHPLDPLCNNINYITDM